MNDTVRAGIRTAIEKIQALTQLPYLAIPFQPKRDLPVLRWVTQDVECRVIDEALTPGEVMALIAKTQFFIGMRLHSLLFSIIQHIPVFGISYDPKVTAVLTMSGQPGMELADVTSDHLTRAIGQAWDQRAQRRQREIEYARHLRREAQRSLRRIAV